MPFTPDRIARVNELLKREIADILQKRGISVPGVLISVVKVHTSSTLQNATVYVSTLGRKGDDADREVLNVLEDFRTEIQRFVAKNVILKYTPVLSFRIDHNIEEGDRVLGVIRRMEDAQEIPADGKEGQPS